MDRETKRYHVKKDDTSRYQYDARIVYNTGESCIETPDRIAFQKSNRDQLYVVEYGMQNRLDLISWKFYGSSAYWWAIASASGVQDPFNVPVGTRLTIPPLEVVRGR